MNDGVVSMGARVEVRENRVQPGSGCTRTTDSGHGFSDSGFGWNLLPQVEGF